MDQQQKETPRQSAGTSAQPTTTTQNAQATDNQYNAYSDPYEVYRQGYGLPSQSYTGTVPSQSQTIDEILARYSKKPEVSQPQKEAPKTDVPLRTSQVGTPSSSILDDITLRSSLYSGYPYDSRSAYPYDRTYPYGSYGGYGSYPYDRTAYPYGSYGYYPYGVQKPVETTTPKADSPTVVEGLRSSQTLGLNPEEFYKKYGFYPSTTSYTSPSSYYYPYGQAPTTSGTYLDKYYPYSYGYTSKPYGTPLTLAYWGGVQGLVQSIRYLLEYTETPYVEKLYENKEDWQKDKANLGMDFANLPYVIDGDKRVAESIAILHYIPSRARRPELLGKNDDDKISVFTIYGVLKDLAQDFGRAFYVKYESEEAFREKMEALFEKNHARLLELQDTIGSKDFLLGYATIVDFQFFYLLDILNRLDAHTMSGYAGLKSYYSKIANIPQIKSYRESGKMPKYFGGPQAYWRG